MGKVAFVLAGQGAQSVGMGRELCEVSAAAREIFNMAEAIRPGASALCFDGPKESLDITANTQPCVFAVDLAAAAALREAGIAPDAVAGFSLGEVPAAAFAGIMTAEQAFEFVCRRADAMQTCAEQNPGEMYAVLRISADVVEEICAGIDRAYPVNYNCEGQTVVACHASSSEAFLAAVAEKKGRAMKLAVSGAFHSPFMDNAAAELADFTASQEFSAPQIPLYANATAMPYGDAAELLARQVNSPVLWQKTIENMIADGFDTFVEVGPGKTLSGLIKKINAAVTICNVCDAQTLGDAAEVLNA